MNSLWLANFSYGESTLTEKDIQLIISRYNHELLQSVFDRGTVLYVFSFLKVLKNDFS